MSARFSAAEIIETVHGRLAQGLMPEGIGSIGTDTRILAEGQWYLALSGENFDGHDFLGDAFARGALGAIVSERASYPISAATFPLIAVADTLAAYHDLARSWRMQVKPKVVGVTGSSGKTTTKEMCAAIMGFGFQTHKSLANENNEIGLPKSILSMAADCQVLIVELAMRALGEIALLAETAVPDVGIIVNAGVAHLGMLGSVEKIVQAKCELLEKLDKESAVAIIGEPTEVLIRRVNQVFAGKVLTFESSVLKEVEVTPESTVFDIPGATGGAKMSRFVIRAHGSAQLKDAWCAIMAARCCGMDDATIAEGLRNYKTIFGRGTRLSTANGALVIDESYNGNPDSVRASVSSFVDDRVFPLAKKYVVIGELAELGDDANEIHVKLGKWLSSQKLSGLITVGRIARNIADGAQKASFEVLACHDLKDAEKVLNDRLSADAGVLIKGSHCARLDQLVSNLVAPLVAKDN